MRLAFTNNLEYRRMSLRFYEDRRKQVDAVINLWHRRLALALAFVVATLLCSSCGRGRGASVAMPQEGDTLRFAYARLLEVVRFDDHTQVTVADPWNRGRTLHTYWLISRKAVGRVRAVPDGVTAVTIPLKRAIPFSTVHASLMTMLGCTKAIAGIADVAYVKQPAIRRLCIERKIADVGSSLAPNTELIVATNPDGLLLSPFENSGGYGKVEELGVPVIECADYMEASALGRAEWVRFYGMLFGAERQADSLFNAVEQHYRKLRAMAAASKGRPTAIVDKMTGNTWYVPGGRSTMGTLLADAGINYVFADNGHSGSLPLSFETVLERADSATLWLLRYESAVTRPYTLRTLLSEHRGYGHIKAFNAGQCYGCDTRTSMVFEETPFRPDLLLEDFVAIAHPETHLHNRYFIKLNP